MADLGVYERCPVERPLRPVAHRERSRHDRVLPPTARVPGPPHQRAHRSSVPAVRGEHAVPEGDAERSQRGGRCLRTTSSRCIQRLPRHVTDRLPPVRGTARGSTRTTRLSVCVDAVTRAVSDFGFWHLGRFAGQYRALFGEPPSGTVAREGRWVLRGAEPDDDRIGTSHTKDTPGTDPAVVAAFDAVTCTNVVGGRRFERLTPSVSRKCSTPELTAR